MLTPQGWIDNGTVVFEDNIITNAGEGKAPIEGAFRTIVLKAGIPLEDAIKMSSLTPARIMHVDDRKSYSLNRILIKRIILRRLNRTPYLLT